MDFTGSLKVGGKVNLERAMSGHGRFGGHFVQVDLNLDLEEAQSIGWRANIAC